MPIAFNCKGDYYIKYKEFLMKYNYDWTLKDATFTKDKGKVFSCFACGGGSTMGYKLAGFDVIGMNEIDPKMAECYIANHNPKYAYIEPIQDFKNREDLPEELYHLDILDGSPPCSSFSMAGNREKDWGEEKKFREGQAEQVLDTLFFDFIDLAEKLKPKVVVAENVKGLLAGEAKSYVNKILIAFDKAGYFVDYKLLNASKMGVPQKRERVFFYAVRKDLYHGEFVDLFGMQPALDLRFNIPQIKSNVLKEDKGEEYKGCFLSEYERWENKEDPKYLQTTFLTVNDVHPTFTAGYGHKAGPMPTWQKNWLSKNGMCKVGSYPKDYNFIKTKPGYLIGMSVPPVMTAQIADRIYQQWLNIY